MKFQIFGPCRPLDIYNCEGPRPWGNMGLARFPKMTSVTCIHTQKHTHTRMYTQTHVHRHTQACTLAQFLCFSALICWGWAYTEAAMTLTQPPLPIQMLCPLPSSFSPELTSNGWEKEEASWTFSLTERREMLRGSGLSSLPAETCLAQPTPAYPSHGFPEAGNMTQA